EVCSFFVDADESRPYPSADGFDARAAQILSADEHAHRVYGMTGPPVRRLDLLDRGRLRGTNRNGHQKEADQEREPRGCCLHCSHGLRLAVSSPRLLRLVALGCMLRAFAHDGVATVEFGEAAQARGQVFVERAITEAPGPVAGHRG